MPITKQYLKSKPECKITFVVPAKEANKVEVAGDFSNWNTSSLKKYKNGNFKGHLNLPVDREYQFRYIVDGEWVNESEADAYKWNDYAATENSVLKV
ncbi:isoamylase early set domain-containing protein [Gramella sp. MAR_2010_147]|uniref:isoamylase early set domain-containing protein n=1 Tax=Gramella sp. MAR_2010_147 TaxID=1250205 RepID=UPI00087A943C|nr:isoamylase early set domain-containing protein [Gramella sp. MAR_2010_147]SDS12447.1 Glycogen recognition site of AMP-activated protein kinase [Gramella sp. MAR_2010_147]